LASWAQLRDIPSAPWPKTFARRVDLLNHKRREWPRLLSYFLSCYWHRRSLEMWTKNAVLFSISQVKLGIYLRERISIFQNFERTWA
jgi:hypothetical protein